MHSVDFLLFDSGAPMPTDICQPKYDWYIFLSILIYYPIQFCYTLFFCALLPRMIFCLLTSCCAERHKIVSGTSVFLDLSVIFQFQNGKWLWKNTIIWRSDYIVSPGQFSVIWSSVLTFVNKVQKASAFLSFTFSLSQSRLLKWNLCLWWDYVYIRMHPW